MKLEKLSLTALALLLMLLLLSGCSGSDGDGFADPTTDDTTTDDTTTDDTTTDDTTTDDTVVVLTNGTLNPVYAEVAVSTRNISIAGVGQLERAGFQVSVYDNSGSLINDANTGVNNVKVSFVSSPNGGEYLQGTSADNTVDTAITGEEIDIRTVNGQVTADLLSGDLPGIVELRVEILDDGGSSFSPPLQATLPYVAIASGLAHSISFSWPNTDAVEVLDGGMYKRKGSIAVTDQFGAPVPDGTVISLTMVNSVFAADNDGSVTAGTAVFTDANASFTTDYIVRNGVVIDGVINNGVYKYIDENDQVLLIDAQAGDKRRYITAAPTSAISLSVQSNYIATTNSTTTPSGELLYVVGTNSSGIGGVMIGMDEVSEVERAGVAVTKDGYARIYILYPADEPTINVGCYTDPTIDTRHLPAGSADIYIVAASSDNEVTAIDNRGCFASVAGWELSSSPDTWFIGVGYNGTLSYDLSLIDGGDKIGMPFITMGSTVKISAGDGNCSDGASTTAAACATALGAWTPNDFNVVVSNCPTTLGRTIYGGYCTSQATVSGSSHNKGDMAEITFFAGDASVTVTIEIPN